MADDDEELYRPQFDNHLIPPVQQRLDQQPEELDVVDAAPDQQLDDRVEAAWEQPQVFVDEEFDQFDLLEVGSEGEVRFSNPEHRSNIEVKL